MEHHTPSSRRRAHRSRRALLVAAALTTAVITTSTATTGTASAGNGGDTALTILLTNDDGWDAPGITAVFDALVAAGHHVTIVAPATNQSGSGARATFGGPMVVTHPAPDKYAVTGSPADATEFGLSTVFAGDPPDLVISGTNAGQNIAAATVHSGTVGAAVTALNEGVPAIAVSTETSFTGTPAPPYADTASFVVQLLDALAALGLRGGLLPAGVGLNVNYPIVDDGGRPHGVALTRTGTGFLDLGYSGATLPPVGGSSTFAIDIALLDEVVPDADSTALAADEVAITPITGNYDAVGISEREFRTMVGALD